MGHQRCLQGHSGEIFCLSLYKGKTAAKAKYVL